MKRLGALAAAAALLGTLGSPFGGSRQTATAAVTGVEQGVWWRQQPDLVDIPAPNTVPPGDLWVQSDLTGPSSISALRFTLGPNDAAPIITLGIDRLTGAPETGVFKLNNPVLACPATSPWTKTDSALPGKWSARPTWDCTKGTIPGVPKGTTHLEFDFTTISAPGQTVDVVLVPGKIGNPVAIGGITGLVPVPVPLPVDLVPTITDAANQVQAAVPGLPGAPEVPDLLGTQVWPIFDLVMAPPTAAAINVVFQEPFDPNAGTEGEEFVDDGGSGDGGSFAGVDDFGGFDGSSGFGSGLTGSGGTGTGTDDGGRAGTGTGVGARPGVAAGAQQVVAVVPLSAGAKTLAGIVFAVLALLGVIVMRDQSVGSTAGGRGAVSLYDMPDSGAGSGEVGMTGRRFGAAAREGKPPPLR